MWCKEEGAAYKQGWEVLEGLIKGGQPKLKTARNRRHMNSMEEGATGKQNELHVGIKTSNIMNVVQGVGRTEDNQVCLFVCLIE